MIQRTVGRWTFWSVLALVTVLGIGYVACPIYLEPVTEPFHGAQWYNPYASTGSETAETRQSARWLDANFHAHSRVWGGLSNGAQPASVVAARYRALGYQVVGISNYQIDASTEPAGVFPVYEHGWNLYKTHQLVLGHAHVTPWDYPLFQGFNQRQHVLDALHHSAPLVAVAHPGLRDSAAVHLLPRLSGFDLLEVFNHFMPPADSAWDAVLSAGHPVWLLGDDDSHDVTGAGQTGINRTRLLSPDTTVPHVLDALRSGRAYAVHGERATPLRLGGVSMRGDTLTVTASGAIRRIRIVGQHGAIRAERTVTTPDVHTVSLRWVARANDPYLRATVEDADGALLYTNPVIRWNGTHFPHPEPIIDRPRTTHWRLTWGAVLVWSAGVLLWTRRRALRPLSA